MFPGNLDAGLYHLPKEVVTFPGTLADTGKDRESVVLFRDIVNKFLDKDGLACPFNDSQDTEAKKKIAAIASKSVDIVRDKYGCVRCIDLKKSGVRCPEIIGFMAEAAENIIKENK